MCDVVLRTRVRPEELWISAALGGPLLPVELSAHTSLLNTSCFFFRKALKKEGLGGCARVRSPQPVGSAPAGGCAPVSE